MSPTKQHQNNLTARLEDAYLNGCAHITLEELYYWYGVEKLAAGTWRDLQNRWEELTEGVEGPLMKIKGRGGIYLFGEKNSEYVYHDGDNE
jgi:hypothetical protein